MPEGVIPAEGLADGLRWTVNNGATQLNAWQLLLFVNDYTPNTNTTLANLVEPSWVGYSRFPLAPNGWSTPDVVEGVAVTTWGTDPIIFVNSVGPTETVYGCAYVDPNTGRLQFAQRFEPGDIRAIAAGESVQIVPRLSRRSHA